MSLTEGFFTAADLSAAAQPGQVFASRIGASLLGAPFATGRLLVARVLGPDDPVEKGALYVLVDDEAQCGAIVRLLGVSPDGSWLVDEFVPTGPCQPRSLPRSQWQPRASIDIK
jgi:hypothetical protein